MSVVQVLVVDDSRVMREMVVASLRGLPDSTFAQAASGLEAIEQLTMRRFDLAILDLNMPDIHGVEVLEFVRAHRGLERLPVLVLTTRSDDDSRERCMAAGASLFKTKPFSPEELLADARGLLGIATAT